MSKTTEYQKQLTKIVASLKKAKTAKNVAVRESALKNIFSEIQNLNFDEFVSEVQNELNQIADERAKAAETRRELVLKEARDRGIHLNRSEKNDTIGAFRIRYLADRIACDFAEEMVFDSMEFDPVIIVNQIQEHHLKLKEGATDRKCFMNQIRKAFNFAKADNPSLVQESGIKLNLLHFYMVLVRAGDHKTFQKSPMKSSFPDYTKLEFYRDLSAFIHGGVVETGWRLKAPTPSLGQIKEAIYIPSIHQPELDTTAVYSIKLERED